MSSISFNKNKVDDTMALLSTIVGNDLAYISNDLTNASNQIINARGFQEYVGVFFNDDLQQYIYEVEDSVNKVIANIANKEIAILEYNGDTSAADSILASLSPSVRSLITMENGAIQADDEASSDNILFKTAATIGTFGVSLFEGVGQVAEAVVDLADMAATGVNSLFKMAGNLFSGKSIMDGVSAMWEQTAARVSQKKCESIFNNFYENNSLGKTLKTNSYGFDTVRSIGNGVGYAIGMTSLAALTFGATGAAAGGMSVAQIGGTAGALGIARGSEKAWADGASVGKGLLYGMANGVWEGAQWAIGAKIGQQGGWGNKLANKLFSKGASSASKAAVSMTRIGLDTVDTAVEGFVQPAMDLIYKDSYINEAGEKVKFTDSDTLVSRYKKLFANAGGWKNVGTQALMGGLGSAFGEAMDASRLLKPADSSSTADLQAGAGDDIELSGNNPGVLALPPSSIDDTATNLFENNRGITTTTISNPTERIITVSEDDIEILDDIETKKMSEELFEDSVQIGDNGDLTPTISNPTERTITVSDNDIQIFDDMETGKELFKGSMEIGENGDLIDLNPSANDPTVNLLDNNSGDSTPTISTPTETTITIPEDESALFDDMVTNKTGKEIFKDTGIDENGDLIDPTPTDYNPTETTITVSEDDIQIFDDMDTGKTGKELFKGSMEIDENGDLINPTPSIDDTAANLFDNNSGNSTPTIPTSTKPTSTMTTIADPKAIFASNHPDAKENIDYHVVKDSKGNSYISWINYQRYLAENADINNQLYSSASKIQRTAMKSYITENRYFSYKTYNGLMRDYFFVFKPDGSLDYIELRGIYDTRKFSPEEFFQNLPNKYHSTREYLNAVSERILGMDELMRANPLQENMILYRGICNDEPSSYINLFGVNPNEVSFEEFREAVLGRKTFETDSFFSTSATDHSGPIIDSAKVVYVLHSPKGTPAVDMSLFGGNIGEQEILIAPNTKYKFTDVKLGSDGRYYIHCELDDAFDSAAARKLFKQKIDTQLNKYTNIAAQYDTNNSTSVQKGTTGGGTNQFGFGQSGDTQFGFAQPGDTQFGFGQSGDTQFGFDQSGDTQFGFAQPGTTQQGATGFNPFELTSKDFYTTAPIFQNKSDLKHYVSNNISMGTSDSTKKIVAAISKRIDTASAASTFASPLDKYYEFLGLWDLGMDADTHTAVMTQVINENKGLRESISAGATEELSNIFKGRYGITDDATIKQIKDSLLGEDFVEKGLGVGSDWDKFMKIIDTPMKEKVQASISSGKEPVIWSSFANEYHDLMDSKFTTISNTSIGGLNFVESVYTNWNGEGSPYRAEDLWSKLSTTYAKACCEAVDANGAGLSSIKFLYPKDKPMDECFGNLFKNAELPEIVSHGTISKITLAKTDPSTMDIIDTVDIDITDAVKYFKMYDTGLGTADKALCEKVFEMFLNKVKEAM